MRILPAFATSTAPSKIYPLKGARLAQEMLVRCYLGA
jgi:hypothetical protein